MSVNSGSSSSYFETGRVINATSDGETHKLCILYKGMGSSMESSIVMLKYNSGDTQPWSETHKLAGATAYVTAAISDDFNKLYVYNNIDGFKIYKKNAGSWEWSLFEGTTNNLYLTNEQFKAGITPTTNNIINIACDSNGNTLSLRGVYDGKVLKYFSDNLPIKKEPYRAVNPFWSKIGSDIDGENSGDELGYATSLSNDGTIVACGAWKNDDSAYLSGHVRIFKYKVFTQSDSNTYHHTSSTQNSTQTKPLIITENISTPPTVGNSYWTQLGSDIDGDAGYDRSGMSLSL